MRKSKVRWDRLSKLAGHLRSIKAEEFDMERWGFSEWQGQQSNETACRTRACALGHSVALFPDELEIDWGKVHQSGDVYYQMARVRHRQRPYLGAARAGALVYGLTKYRAEIMFYHGPNDPQRYAAWLDACVAAGRFVPMPDPPQWQP
jgi:hypothetical protein